MFLYYGGKLENLERTKQTHTFATHTTIEAKFPVRMKQNIKPVLDLRPSSGRKQ